MCGEVQSSKSKVQTNPKVQTNQPCGAGVGQFPRLDLIPFFEL
jgi:hypothetical protein